MSSFPGNSNLLANLGKIPISHKEIIMALYESVIIGRQDLTPNQFEELIEELKNHKGSTSFEFRKKMSRLAFTETAYYDSLIANYFNKISNINFPNKKITHKNC